MEDFTASNGIVITPALGLGTAKINVSGVGFTFSLDGDRCAALREFFRHERDTELGRWRWPEDPRNVVYKKKNGTFLVLRESTGYSTVLTQLAAEEFPDTWDGAAVLAYLAAHEPQRPWHDAKPGEIWALTVDGEECAWRAGSGAYQGRFILAGDGSFSNLPSDHPSITAGRRIWPEVVSDGA